MSDCHPCDAGFVLIFFKTMYKKTIIRFGSADNTYLDLAYSEYHGKNFIQWLLSVTPLASGLEPVCTAM